MLSIRISITMCSIFIGWRMLCILFVISLDVSRRICSMLYRRFDFKCKTNTKKRYSVIDTCGSTFGSFSLLIFIEIFYDWKYFKLYSCYSFKSIAIFSLFHFITSIFYIYISIACQYIDSLIQRIFSAHATIYRGMLFFSLSLYLFFLHFEIYIHI